MRYEILKKAGKFVVEVNGKQIGTPHTSMDKAVQALREQRDKDRG